MTDCCCSDGGIRLLYTCSGASDVGELTDRAVRKLWSENFAQKSCLAGVGGDVPGFVTSAQGADVNITVDGCPLLCARRTLERIGVKPVAIMLADHGYKKGSSPATEEAVEAVARIIREHSGVQDTQAEMKGPGGCGCGCS